MEPSKFKKFKKYVDHVLNESHSGAEVERKYGVTPKKQSFVIIVTKAVWYAVRIIMDTNYKKKFKLPYGHLKDYVFYPGENIYSYGILVYQQFLLKMNVDSFVNQWYEKLEKGIFDDTIYTRFVSMPVDCVKNYDKYLKPGDHLRRKMITGNFHDGIYIGNGLVAHMSTPEDAPALKFISAAGPRQDTLKTFAKEQTITIVEHCIRRKTGDEIAEFAKKLVSDGHHDYDLSNFNCQHFCYLCAIGKKVMSPSDERQAKLAGAILFY